MNKIIVLMLIFCFLNIAIVIADNVEYNEFNTVYVIKGNQSVYDGDVNTDIGGGYFRTPSASFMMLGSPYMASFTYYASFIEFNTTNIPKFANILNVSLNVTINESVGAGGGSTMIYNVSLSKLTQRPSNGSIFPDTTDGNHWLWNNITVGYNKIGFYAANITTYNTTGVKNYTFNISTILDLQSNLNSTKFFAVGITRDPLLTPFGEHDTFYQTEEIRGQPSLRIVYDTCQPPAIGNWTINHTCSFYNTKINLTNDLLIKENGRLILNRTILNFTSISSSRIYIYFNNTKRQAIIMKNSSSIRGRG